VKWQAGLDAGRVLSTSSLKLMRTATTLSDGTVVDYGLGTRLGMLEGHRVLGHTGGGGGFAGALDYFPDDHLTIVVLVNTEVGANPALTLAAGIARPLLGLPEKTLRDLPVPQQELAALTPGTFNSDEGTVETFARGGKLFYRDLPSRAEGPLLRQAENVYAVNEKTEVHFVIRQGHATWGIVYTGGMMMDATRRMK
jgi:CubicO group peptidase (beta-lactamase class C family)